MKLHANAALSLKGRRHLCQRVLEEGWTVTEAAAAAEVSVRCARKWIGRYQADGELGLLDRSSAPDSIPHRTSERRVQAIVALRRLRFTGPEIAEVLGMAPSTVSAILTRIGMGKLGRVGLEPAQRYERERPGELVHIDIKKLGRIERGAGARIVGMANRGSRPKRRDAAGVDRQTAGWEYVHIAVDDCTRLAYAEVLRNHKAPTVVAFLRRAVQFFARHGVTVERVLTDNGSSYCGTVHAIACRALGIRHLRTRPYRPQTNGKAERFIRTLLGGWAYGAAYRNSAERTAALDGWLWYYNHQRRHSALGHKPPIARLNERTNLPGTYTYAPQRRLGRRGRSVGSIEVPESSSAGNSSLRLIARAATRSPLPLRSVAGPEQKWIVLHQTAVMQPVVRDSGSLHLLRSGGRPRPSQAVAGLDPDASSWAVAGATEVWEIVSFSHRAQPAASGR